MTTPHNLPEVINGTATDKQPGDVYIGRGSPWGNPWPVTSRRSRAEAIALFADHLNQHPELVMQLHEANPKRLRCFCKPLACHGDVLVEALQRYRNNL